ncbi:MAG: hypothetical protein KF811_10885 [Dokdonella sp.]|nr:hypothetical protein [Dokdonella sp.]
MQSRLRAHWFNSVTEESLKDAKTEAGGAYGQISLNFGQAKEEAQKLAALNDWEYSKEDSVAALRNSLDAAGFEAWSKCMQGDPAHEPLFEARVIGPADGLEFEIVLTWHQPSRTGPVPLKNLSTTIPGLLNFKPGMDLPTGISNFRVRRQSPTEAIFGSFTGTFEKDRLPAEVRIPAYRPIALPSYPILLTESSLVLGGCKNRGGDVCFNKGGVVVTPPANNSTAVASFHVPFGARYFLASLRKYSGAECEKGEATARIDLDGVEVATYPLLLANQDLVVGIPEGARTISLKTSSDGSEWCDDPAWYSARFERVVQAQ